MNESEIIRARECRADVVAWMKDHGMEAVEEAHLEDVDKRLRQYAIGVVGHPDDHNLYELLALRRFLDMHSRCTFDARRAKAVALVLETIKFPTPKGMQPLKLSPVQLFLLSGIYGFVKKDGSRLTRNAMLFVPRKFGKTTTVAGLAIYELLFGDADGQVFSCANSYQQAKISFDNIRASLRALDKEGNRFKVNREAIYCLSRGRKAFARCLAADPTTLDGLNASCYILDEFSQAKSADLRNVMSTSTGTRKSPLELIITTASEQEVGPCVDTLNAYKSILRGEKEDDSVFALIFQPDVDDAEDDPHTWAKVQPHMGVTVQPDYYAAKWKEAQQTSDNLFAFRTKLLNVFAKNETAQWITGDEVRHLFRPYDIDAENRLPMCAVAVDLSVWDDFSAVTYAVRDDELHKVHFHTEYYIPEETIEKHARRELYRTWVQKGFLHAVPGLVMDYSTIVQDIIRRNGKVLIAAIAYDPYKSKEFVDLLKAAGAGPVLREAKQTYGGFTASVMTMEMMIKADKCTFSPNEITAWCFGNCVIDEDKIGNRKPIKARHTDKIDGAITCLMALAQMQDFKQ